MNIVKGKQDRPQRLVVYGQEGVGKTTLAAQLPSPLVLDTEAGSGQLEVDRVDIGSLAQLGDVLREVLQARRAGTFQYRTVVLDTVDRIWNMAAEAVVADNNWKSIEDGKFGKGLTMATEKFCTCITALDRLVEAGLYVVCVCHAKVETVSPPDKADYTMYQLKVSAPGKQAGEAAAFLKQWADSVLFCQFNTLVDSESGKARAQKRVIRTAHGACWEAKNRYGLPETLNMDAEGVRALVMAVYGDVPASAGSSSVASQAAEAAPRDLNDPLEPPCPAATSAPAPASAPSPAPAPAPARDAADDIAAWAAEDQVLVEWLRSQGKLQVNQGLDDLDKKYKLALQTPERKARALELARAWKEQQKGDRQ